MSDVFRLYPGIRTIMQDAYRCDYLKKWSEYYCTGAKACQPIIRKKKNETFNLIPAA